MWSLPFCSEIFYDRYINTYQSNKRAHIYHRWIIKQSNIILTTLWKTILNRIILKVCDVPLLFQCIRRLSRGLHCEDLLYIHYIQYLDFQSTVLTGLTNLFSKADSYCSYRDSSLHSTQPLTKSWKRQKLTTVYVYSVINPHFSIGSECSQELLPFFLAQINMKTSLKL